MVAGTTPKLAKKTAAMIEECVAILAEQHPMTLRGLHYQLVSRGFYDNTQPNYKRLGRAMVKAREYEIVSWSWIVDNLRQTLKPASWSGLDEYADDTVYGYRLDFWSHLHVQLAVFVEKDAQAGVLWPVTREFDVPLYVVRGYSSVGYLHDIAEAWADSTKPIYAYCMSDFDPSGFDLERWMSEKLAEYSGREVFGEKPTASQVAGDEFVVWRRLAVMLSDFDEHDLYPVPPKQSDPRFKKFAEEYGDDQQCAELDAVPPDVLRQRLREAIEQHFDEDQWEGLRQVEHEDRQALEEAMSGLTDAP